MRKSRNQYYIDMVSVVAERSTCARRAVGAIITTEEGEILSTGYNGPPRGLPHCIDTPCAGRYDPKGDTTRCEAVHAEINALLQCKRFDLMHTLYVSCTPCFKCALTIANTRIKRIVVGEPYADENGVRILTLAGIELIIRARTGV